MSSVSEEYESRQRAIERLLDEIIDPCSAAAGTPIGIADMGIVDKVEVGQAGQVEVRLLPTFPGCRFVAIFESIIQERLGALDWCTRVDVVFAGPEEIWDESRMSSDARNALDTKRKMMRPRVVRPLPVSGTPTTGAHTADAA
jgi:metal-sulfur cluster biosynthetic enzyme